MEINKYVPILRTKRGEHVALKKVDPELLGLFTPLYELRKIPLSGEDKGSTLKNYIENTAKKCAESWSDQEAIIFDTPGLSDSKVTEDGKNAIDFFYSELKAFGTKLIPTVTTDRGDGFCSLIRKHSRSFIFRVQSDDLEMPKATADTIRDQLKKLKAQSERCHILIDLKHQGVFDSGSLLDLISSFTDEIDAAIWSSLTFAGCSFPEDMSGVKKHEAVYIPRKNFECWQELNDSHQLIGAKLGFGDYGIVNPLKPELDGFAIKNIPSKIRYTANKDWLIYRGDGHEDREDKYDDYQTLAHKIVNTDHFLGKDFSWGDKCLYECSSGKQRICGLEKWVQIDMNHHITLVAQQVDEVHAGLED